MTVKFISALTQRLANVRMPRALAGCIIAVILAGCSSGSPEAPADDDNSDDGYALYFKISLPTASSRASDNSDWGEYSPAETGDEFENRIYTETIRLHIYSFDDSGNPHFISSVKPTEIVPGTTIEDYVFKVSLTDITYPIYEKGRLRVMMTANCDTGSDISTSGNGLTYSSADLKTKGIPFFGIATIPYPVYGENPVTIELLRACAKIEIEMSAEMLAKGYYIREGSTCGSPEAGVNLSGYVLPDGWETAASTASLTHSGCLRPFTGSTGVAGDFDTQPAENGGLKKIRIYLPELKNGTGNDERYITLNYYNPDVDYPKETSTRLYFRTYTNGGATNSSPIDIIRNHIYRYTIKGVTSNQFDYAVCQWGEAVSGDINFQ